MDNAAGQAVLSVDALASTARPPAGIVDASAATYALLGLNGEALAGRWRFYGTGSMGHGFEDDAGRWYWLQGGFQRGWWIGSNEIELRAAGSRLSYHDPLNYNATLLELQPFLSLGTGNRIVIRPSAVLGEWHASEQDPPIGVPNRAEARGSISVGGLALELQRTRDWLFTALTVEAHSAHNDARNGYFGGVSLTAGSNFGGWDIAGTARYWRNPQESEFGWTVGASKFLLPNMQMIVQVGRTVMDPVFAAPGNLGLSAGIHWRIARHEWARAQLAAIGAPSGGGRKVRFSLKVPGAKSVELSGTFSGWNPIALRRSGEDTWAVELVIPAGSHQYSFIVDRQWYLPPEASGLVDDGFGRKNATLVVEKP